MIYLANEVAFKLLNVNKILQVLILSNALEGLSINGMHIDKDIFWCIFFRSVTIHLSWTKIIESNWYYIADTFD